VPVPPAPLPLNEASRLAALRATGILDTPPDPHFDRLVRMVSVLMDVPVALVSLVDEERQWFKASVGYDHKETPRRGSFCDHALHSHDLLVVPDASLDPRFIDSQLVSQTGGIRFYAGAPLLLPAGQIAGTLCAIDFRPREISLSERWLLKELADTTVGLIGLHSTQAELEQRARLDPLTGLLTRTAYLDCLAHCLAREKSPGEVAVVLLDFTGVSAINALLGYAVGDSLLKLAARALASALPRGASIGRVGGVRFAATLNLSNQVAPEVIAVQVQHQVASMLAAAGWNVGVTCVAAPCAPGQNDAEFALSLADRAVRAARPLASGGSAPPEAMTSSAA
jgi:diguanylate cyclase (GGDEF)-like protein